MPRCSTREPRQGDAADGVTSISWDEFRARRAICTFVLSWERPLADGSSIGYGCLKPSGDRLPILTAGHGIYTNMATVQPAVHGLRARANPRRHCARRRTCGTAAASLDVVARGLAAMEMFMAHHDATMLSNVDMLVRNYDATEVAVVNDFVCALAHVLNLAG